MIRGLRRRPQEARLRWREVAGGLDRGHRVVEAGGLAGDQAVPGDPERAGVPVIAQHAPQQESPKSEQRRQEPPEEWPDEQGGRGRAQLQPSAAGAARRALFHENARLAAAPGVFFMKTRVSAQPRAFFS